MAMNPVISRGARDRRLYILAAIFIPIIVLLGFARTYYLRGFFDTPPLPSLMVQVHGLVMTLWVALFVAQVWLVSSRRTKIHMKLGVLGAILAALVIIVGVLTAIFAAARGSSPGPPPLQFLVIPLGDMVVFGILVGLALYYRRKLETHKRLMLLAAVNFLAPAIARIPLSFIANGGALAFFGLTDICILAVVAIDTIKNRRLHPVFAWGVPLVILFQPLRIVLAGTDVWMRFAKWLVSLV